MQRKGQRGFFPVELNTIRVIRDKDAWTSRSVQIRFVGLSFAPCGIGSFLGTQQHSRRRTATCNAQLPFMVGSARNTTGS
jgi:hypothetical protein